MRRTPLETRLQTARLALGAVRSLGMFIYEEGRRGTLVTNLKGLGRLDLAQDMSWADLLAERAGQVPDKCFLKYRDERYSYGRMNRNANRMANFLLKNGGGKGLGVGILMKNSPRFLDIFFGLQKLGMYAVPINPEIKSDGLKYVIEHSEISFLALDAELLDIFAGIEGEVKLRGVLVDDLEEESKGIAIPDGALRFSRAYAPEVSEADPGVGYNMNDMCLIMYTSGTTGKRKGVVYRYRNSTVKKICIISNILVRPDDVLYTPLSLIHGNSLFLCVTAAMAAGATVALSRKFSASRFWDEVRTYGATTFNTLGSMIPILIKQPPRPSDADNKVRFVLSAACLAEMWETFEKRFGVEIYEGYGAVDGGGKGIMNFGTAPVGSLGRPVRGVVNLRLVDSAGNDVLPGVQGS